MKAKPLIIALGVSFALSAATAEAGFRGGFQDKARVIYSAPIYEQVNEPTRSCWTETVGYDEQVYRDGGNHGGAIIGAIAGGLLGSTVGAGSGKTAAAAVGAATGAIIGDRMDGPPRYYRASVPRQVERCRVVNHVRNVVVGYDVVYRYHGQEYRTRMPQQPGRWIAVDVGVAPAAHARHFDDDDD